MHIFLSGLISEILLQLFQKRVKPFVFGLVDADSSQQGFVGQISFGQFSWIQKGYLVVFAHQ